MKVACAPFIVLGDQGRCELSILSGGFRVTMTGEEAGALWVELGTALKQLYADRPQQCSQESDAAPTKESADDPAQTPTPFRAQRPAETAFRRLMRDTFEKKRRSQ